MQKAIQRDRNINHSLKFNIYIKFKNNDRDYSHVFVAYYTFNLLLYIYYIIYMLNCIFFFVAMSPTNYTIVQVYVTDDTTFIKTIFITSRISL